MLETMVSPRKALGQRLRVERLEPVVAGGEAQLLQQLRHLQAGVGVAQALGHRHFVRVGQDARAAVAHRGQRVGRGADHQVAGQDGVGLLGVDAHLVQPRRHVGQRTNDSTEPPFCAKPMKSSTLALLPSRCAAIVMSAPTVTTPVPPTPVTSRS
jgi:hypothetical protein